MPQLTIASQVVEPFDLPADLKPLEDLALNLRWTWTPEVQALFQAIDPARWARGIGPVALLRDSKAIEALSDDKKFARRVASAAKDLEGYLANDGGTWYRTQGGKAFEKGPVAYFCAEYALHVSMNQYAGGLGILAGDHCKEASDMGLPFVPVGMFYRRGFFQQMVDFDGRQEHLYPTYDPAFLPIRRVLDPRSGCPLTIALELPGRTLVIAVWLMQVGRVPLLLMDSDLPVNREEDRPITSQTYTNTREMRICQEFVLGVGGVRVLRALGIAPSVWHMNEGHSALLVLERLREAVEAGSSFASARDKVRTGSIITIHTPVPEGNERFDAKLVSNLIEPLLKSSGLKAKDIMKLGLGADGDAKIFDMTAFGLRHSAAANGVSLLHGETADKTWRKTLGRKVIGVTNGIHVPTWLGPEMRKVYESAGAKFQHATDVKVKAEARPKWEGALELDDAALWQAHQRQKSALIEFAKGRLLSQHARLGEGPSALRELVESLDPDAFLIGFARRFATYKRAGLLFTDERRVLRLFDAPGRKVQVLFAGKSHPTDRGGQAVVQQVYAKTQERRFKGKVFLLEDYDMEVGARLVQGVDLWLNNPRRPLEASGTSGMKAAANGIPNASILDGWWDEAFESGRAQNGFAIGGRTIPKVLEKQDKQDAKALYRCLEEEVLPAFFERDKNGVPSAWLPLMKNAIASSLYSFSTSRMIRDYVEEMYAAAAKGFK